MKMLAGILKPDDQTIEMPRPNLTYISQTFSYKFEGTVKDLFYTTLGEAWKSERFKKEVFIPLGIN